MARAKKEAALTPEERLQAALVPDWQWPHKLPENWCWVYAPHIFDIEYGKSLPTKQLSDTGYPVFGANGQIGFYSEYMYKQPQALMSCRGAYSGTMNKSLPYSYVTSNSLIISSPRGLMGTDCIYYLFSALNVSELISGTAQPQVTVQAFDGFPIPLSPLAEQQRIVERIESLFAKLDEAKEKAQAVVDSFETRKAAILHKAFTGELTAKWREEHGVVMESWEKYKFNELGTLERGRSKHRPRNDPKLFGGKYPFIQTGDVARSGMYITEHTQTLSEVGAEQSKLFPKGTLCITIAANIGDVSILTYDCCFPDSVVGFTPNERTLSEYIYYLMSTLQREIEANAPATAQKNINLRILNDLLLDIPSVAEQTQIVNQVEYLFFQEQHAKEAAEAVLDQIDLMKKSILTRAFRGELGTNDPSEESAVELLKQIF